MREEEAGRTMRGGKHPDLSPPSFSAKLCTP